uniref:Stromal cell derived factor 2 like 1 n=1 Tax=Leptobrachium leishanense TaxID=445787 RepID=A0A8C5MMI8_9ANUR
MLRAGVRLLLLGLCCCSWLAAEDSHDAEFVTCGSVVKLLNTRHNVRLHSHDVKYGSGSGQQSVTGVEASDDVNSYWRIRGKIDGDCVRGEPIKCGQAIRLTHVNTGKNLHTHHFSSPLSNNQEVSAFGDDGEGDDLDAWIVQCSDTLWEREDSVRFKHVGTTSNGLAYVILGKATWLLAITKSHPPPPYPLHGQSTRPLSLQTAF